MDPGTAQTSDSIPIVNQVFDQLVTLDANLTPELWGADKLDISPDGLTYTFHIRAHQKFSDGTPVKASDYAFALNRAANPCLASPTGGYLSPLKDAATFLGEPCGGNGKTVIGAIQTLIGDSIVADDSASTLTLTLSQPAASFEEALSYPTAAPIEQSVLGDGLGANGKWTDKLSTPMGNSGMFNIKLWDHHGHLDLVPNPEWWGVAAGKKITFSEVDYTIFEDDDTLYSTYQSDPTAAFADAIPDAQVAAAKSDPDYKTARSSSSAAWRSTGRSSRSTTRTRVWRSAKSSTATRSRRTSPKARPTRRGTSCRKACRATTRTFGARTTCRPVAA